MLYAPAAEMRWTWLFLAQMGGVYCSCRAEHCCCSWSMTLPGLQKTSGLSVPSTRCHCFCALHPPLDFSLTAFQAVQVASRALQGSRAPEGGRDSGPNWHIEERGPQETVLPGGHRLGCHCRLRASCWLCGLCCCLASIVTHMPADQKLMSQPRQAAPSCDKVP